MNSGECLMKYNKNEIKAGAFILVCLVIFAIFILSISELDFKAEKAHYLVRYKYIGGISRGSLVRYGGMEIGHVTEIRVPADGDTRIELMLEVTADTPIKTDSEAFLTTIGIMGATYVEITLGSAQAALLPENSLISCLEMTSVSQLTGSAGQITTRLELFLDRLNDLLNERNREAFGTLMQGTNSLLAGENGRMAILMGNLTSLSAELQATIASLNRLIETNESTVAQSLENVPEIMEGTKKVLESLERTSFHLDHIVMANSENYAEIVKDMQRTAQNLEEFSRIIKERPWTIIRKTAPPERDLRK